tara:strand:- start:9051 stop:9428 length:378 start_codon:yes stop_codon:yes gene_type:complete
MNSGRARQRRRFLSVPTTMAATWRLSTRMAVIFEGFYEHELKDNEWFLLFIPTPQGLVEHEARFINSPMENYKPLGADKWSYQANIEIKKRKKPSEYEVVNETLKPKNLNDFVTKFTNVLTNYED